MDVNGNLNAQARYVLDQVSALEGIISRSISKSWEQEYRCKDLADEISRLKRQLRDSVPLGSRDGSSEAPVTALEASLGERIIYLETRLARVVERLGDEISRNWELEYRCKDLNENVLRLKTELRDCVRQSDVASPRLNPRAALERSLEDRIMLEGGVGQTRARSKSM
ncbi:hypothetical protein B0T26DRAFT_757185 [Lasiosphaeria miniovina]|uniref:Uncharacterized protein n=1 Tax=Lasiosphaeria miniovina TaxID=1954250 RepID=A0AA39ZU09_9PEZI|nr:uncharacterized protein B0T26DRAFT_757185 [Lasiosphaeria miniovina]KAK0703667.1 hypothetical protein B0T26DRAFT_757185 [Lasiosphaeria miniovina]